MNLEAKFARAREQSSIQQATTIYFELLRPSDDGCLALGSFCSLRRQPCSRWPPIPPGAQRLELAVNRSRHSSMLALNGSQAMA